MQAEFVLGMTRFKWLEDWTENHSVFGNKNCVENAVPQRLKPSSGARERTGMSVTKGTGHVGNTFRLVEV